jgi:hypothetical protein
VVNDEDSHARQMIEALCGYEPEDVASHVCSAVHMNIISKESGQAILVDRIPDESRRRHLVEQAQSMLDTIDMPAMRNCADMMTRGLEKGVVLEPELQRALMIRTVRPQAYAELLAAMLTENDTSPEDALLHLILLERSGSVSAEMGRRVGIILCGSDGNLDEALVEARRRVGLIPQADLEEIDECRRSTDGWSLLSAMR